MTKPVLFKKRLYVFISFICLTLLLCNFVSSEEMQDSNKRFLDYYNQSERMIYTKNHKTLFAIRDRSDGIYVVNEATLLDSEGHELWKTELPNKLVANMTFSVTETSEGFIAFMGIRQEDKKSSLTLLDQDGQVLNTSLVVDEGMLNPIVVSDGIVFMRIEEKTGVRILYKKTWNGNTTEAVLDGVTRFAAYVAQTQKHNTYVYGFASDSQTNISDALFVIDQRGDITWKYAKENESVIPVWYELDNGDTIIFTSSENSNRSFIRRVSSKGDIVWSREIVGTGSHFTPKQIYEDPDGLLNVAGYAKMTTPVADRMIFIITFTSEGIEKRFELIKDHLLLPATHNAKEMILLNTTEDANENSLVPLLQVTRESQGHISLK